MMSHDKTKILSFFNTATIEELQSMPGCSKKKADSIMEIRPFDNWAQLVRRFVVLLNSRAITVVIGQNMVM